MSNIEKIVSAMEQAKPVLEMMLDFKMNYKPQSLKKVEQYLAQRTTQDTPVPWQVQAFLGTYLGEVVIRNIKGAKWEDAEDASSLSLHIPSPNGHFQVFPIIRISKFISDHENGLYPFYCMIQDMVNNRFSPQDALIPGSEYVDMPRGYKMRSIMVSAELRKRFDNGEISQSEMVEMAKKEQGITD